MVVLDPVIPSDPPGPGPIIAATLLAERFHRVRLFKSHDSISYGAGFPAETLEIPVVQLYPPGVPLPPPVVLPSGLLHKEFQAERFLGPGVGRPFHSSLILTTKTIEGSAPRLRRFPCRMFTLGPQDQATSLLPVPIAAFHPNPTTLEARVEGRVLRFRWLRLRDHTSLDLDSPNVFYQITPWIV